MVETKPADQNLVYQHKWLPLVADEIRCLKKGDNIFFRREPAVFLKKSLFDATILLKGEERIVPLRDLEINRTTVTDRRSIKFGDLKPGYIVQNTLDGKRHLVVLNQQRSGLQECKQGATPCFFHWGVPPLIRLA